MPRRNRNARETGQSPRPLRATSVQRIESWGGANWVVRTVLAGSSTKEYRCPGCDHEVAPGVAHLVVWPSDVLEGASQRRHWHTPCWSRRSAHTPKA